MNMVVMAIGDDAVSVWAIVLAAGRGERFGVQKQFELLGDKSLLAHAVDAALAACDGVVAVLPTDERLDDNARVRSAVGGATRTASVRAGLARVPDRAAIVVVHDAAHPLASSDLFRRVIDAVRAGAPAAVPAVRTSDVVAHTELGYLTTPVAREGLAVVQVPHAFRADVLRAAHVDGPEAVDDASMLRAAGVEVAIVDGEVANLHVTTPEELELVRAIHRGSGQTTTGSGTGTTNRPPAAR